MRAEPACPLPSDLSGSVQQGMACGRSPRAHPLPISAIALVRQRLERQGAEQGVVGHESDEEGASRDRGAEAEWGAPASCDNRPGET